MNYAQTIEYLYEQLPMFSKVGASALKTGLDNIERLCGLLGHPEKKFRSIHIAGTNGKGSTSHMLSAILQTAGYKTGLYTSPHLHDFRERIRINGEMITEEAVVRFVERLQPHLQKIQPSFFEITVAMAFEYFAEKQVDIAVVETGLGGRLDSTNIITPVLSLITNISFDHMQILGDTLQKIAVEKAGIIKQEIPVVISETQRATASVFLDTAKEKNAPVIFADQVKQVTAHTPEVEHLRLRVNETEYLLDLPGRYQEKNLLGVLAAVDILNESGYQLSEAQVKEALAKVKKLTGLHGRWEVVNHAPYTVLDVGHNEAGISAILGQLAHVTYKRLHIVTGFVKDKDVTAALRQLPADAEYYFTKAQIPRAMDEQQLLVLAGGAGLKGKAYANVPSAYRAAQAAANKEDMILVCGSVFIVGEVPV